MAYKTILLEAQREYALRPAILWDLLAKTDDLDRETGMPTVAYGPVVVSADGFYRQAAARFRGLLTVRWREYPFDWVRGERYTFLRVFEAGFLDTFYGGAELSPVGNGTAVRLFAELTPRTLLGWGVARVMGRRGLRDTLAFCERAVALQGSDSDIGVAPPSHATPVNQARLDQLVEALRAASLPERLVQRFARHVTGAPDREVLRMQPFGLADLWGAERAEILRLCIQAARVGCLYHTWEVMCPNCRVPKASASTVAGIPQQFHCDTCGIDYAADLARSVELRYSVHPSLRAAKEVVYCIGGPAYSPHVWVQQYLLAGTERVVSVKLGDEPFRARALRANAICPLEPDAAGPPEVAFTYRDDGWLQMQQRFRPGRVTIRLRNETSQVVVVVIEQERWDPRAITATQVLSLDEFRDVAGVVAGTASQVGSGE
jgi:adenylate cyclase